MTTRNTYRNSYRPTYRNTTGLKYGGGGGGPTSYVITGLPTVNSGDWIEEGSHTTFDGAENGYLDTAAGTNLADAYIDENFKGVLESKSHRITFDMQTDKTGSVVMGVAQGSSFSHKPGATGSGTVSDVVGCTNSTNKITFIISVDEITHVEFTLTDPSTVFDYLIFQVDSGLSGGYWNIWNFQMTEL